MSEIKLEIESGVAKIRMNRPEKKNALTHDMYTRLTESFNTAEKDPAVRVILLTGTDKIFTAGNDLGDFLNHPPKDESSPVLTFLSVLSTLKKPLIAAATGPAVGVGTTIFLHCDLVYLGESAHLKLPFVNLGLCPEAASSYLLPQLIGYQRAAQAILLGEPISAEQAKHWGLANEIFSDATYQDEAFQKALALAKQPAAAVRLSKELLKMGTQEVINERVKIEGKHFLERLTSPEAKEAMQAFFEKRQPNFTQFN